MERPSATKWFRLRVACAVGVLAGLAFELSGQRSWPWILLQAVLIVGIIVTSALDLRDLRSRRKATPGPPKRVGDPLQHEWGTPGPTCNRPLGLEPSGSAEPSLGRS